MVDCFTAIDFETSQGKRWSICQIGLVRIEAGIIKDSLSFLVQPPSNFYWSSFTDIHGIGPDQTVDAPPFDIVWPQIVPFINGHNVVAHNGFAFDFPVLTKTLEYYGMEKPEFTGHWTYKIFKKNLARLCQQYHIPLNHHDALSDALASAELYKIHLNQLSIE